jgi:NAD(P)-dependent dehydrogenase (short-subunit alcohol dehydrogenase family)
MRLAGKVAIITGAASGLGRASAKLFAEQGASVVVADRDGAGGLETVTQIRDTGGQAEFIETDVAVADDVDAMVAKAVTCFGKLDVLFNNAGIAIRKPVADLSEDEWDRCIDTNLKGVFLGSKSAIPEMIRGGGGSIINTASIYGVVGGRTRAAYSASKGGIVNLTRSMALDYASQNIRVNCICPGFVETPLLKKILGTEAEFQALVDMHPMGRLGRPIETAYAAVYLASDEAAFTTGIALPVDGGYTAG